jgi:hypothetical protein
VIVTQWGISNIVAGVIIPTASPAATVSALNVEPGSYWSAIARIRTSSAVACPYGRLPGPGAEAIPRTPNVRGSITIAITLAARVRSSVRSTSASAAACTSRSTVSARRLPSRAPSSFTGDAASPVRVWTKISRPSTPCRVRS